MSSDTPLLSTLTWKSERNIKIKGLRLNKFTEPQIEQHLLYRFWEDIPEFQELLLPVNKEGNFKCTLDDNQLCDIVYVPDKTYPKFTTDVTVTWYPQTNKERKEKWILTFLRVKNGESMIRNGKKCVSSFNFDHVYTNGTTVTTIKLESNKAQLQYMRSFLDLHVTDTGP